MVSYPRTPRNQLFRTQRKYEIPKLTLRLTKTLHTPVQAGLFSFKVFTHFYHIRDSKQ